MIWQRYFQRGIPPYLAKHYWWAYLWRWGVWFFDHPLIINLILLGQYNKLVDATLETISVPVVRALQLTSVYGQFTPRLHQHLQGTEELHLADVAAIQLAISHRKLDNNTTGPICHLAQMNATRLGYQDKSFDLICIYFLLHELPPSERIQVLRECLRLLAPGGQLIITEYHEDHGRHWLHKNPLTRWLLGQLEPFLPEFWRLPLGKTLSEISREQDKEIALLTEHGFLKDFYRVVSMTLHA